VSAPLGAWRAFRLLTGLGLRRWLNRISSGAPARRLQGGGAPTGARPPTARRRAGALAVILLLFPSIGIQMGMGAWRHLGDAAAHASGWIEPDASTVADVSGMIYGAAGHPPADPGADAAWWREIDARLARDPGLQTLAPERRQAVIGQWRHLIATRSTAWGARGMEGRYELVRGDSAAAAGARHAAALALLLICLYLLATGLGMGNQDLGQVEWSLLWYATQPVPDRVLVATQWLQAALFSLAGWVVLPPFFFVCALMGGLGWWSAPVALAAALAVLAAIAALRVTIETWLRLHLAAPKLKNIQAGTTVVSLVLMVAIYAVAFGTAPGWYLDRATAVPWDLQPLGWLARAAFAGPGALVAGLGGMLAAVLATWAALALCARWLGRGLADSGGVFTGTRAAHRAARGWGPLSLLRKDLLLLGRDRTVLVQVLVVPLFVVALQLVVNHDVAAAIARDFRHAAVLAFVLGAYVLLNSATTVLTIEGSALWLLCGAPQPLERLLQQKVVLWASLALAYACVALAVALALVPVGPSALGDAVMVLLGLPVYAVIAAGLGAAASDPLEVVPQRRLKPATLYLYLVLMGMYTQAIYVADTHGRLAYLMLSGVLAYALWQRLADRLPYLLDPADRPPRELALSDGALAAMTFLVAQGLVLLLLVQAQVAMGTALPWAFAAAGAIAALLALGLLARERVAGLWRVTGILPRAGARGPLANLAIGMAAGLAAAGVAALWLQALQRVEFLRPLMPTAPVAVPLGGPVLVVLCVGLAPLCEEFVFRGLVHGGLRRSLPLRWAAPAAAAIFALVHPTVSVVPVFALGLAASLAFEAGGWLLAPIVAHAVYNGIVLALQS
jgi:hypothetical protein